MLAVAEALIVGGDDVEAACERRDQVAILMRRRRPTVQQHELGVLRVTGFAIGDGEAVDLDRAVADLGRGDRGRDDGRGCIGGNRHDEGGCGDDGAEDGCEQAGFTGHWIILLMGGCDRPTEFGRLALHGLAMGSGGLSGFDNGEVDLGLEDLVDVEGPGIQHDVLDDLEELGVGVTG